MKCAILRVDSLPGHYVARVGHDGGFSITKDKAKARTFTPETAAAALARLAPTRMQFSICPAAHIGPVAAPHVEAYIARVCAA